MKFSSERGTIISAVFSFILNISLFTFAMGFLEAAIRIPQIHRTLLQSSYAIKLAAYANYNVAYAPPNFNRLILGTGVTADKNSQLNWYSKSNSGWDTTVGRLALNLMLGSMKESQDRVEFPPRWVKGKALFTPALRSVEVKLANNKGDGGTGSVSVSGVQISSINTGDNSTNIKVRTKPYLFNILGKMFGISNSSELLISGEANLYSMTFADSELPRADNDWPRSSPGGNMQFPDAYNGGIFEPEKPGAGGSAGGPSKGKGL